MNLSEHEEERAVDVENAVNRLDDLSMDDSDDADDGLDLRSRQHVVDAPPSTKEGDVQSVHGRLDQSPEEMALEASFCRYLGERVPPAFILDPYGNPAPLQDLPAFRLAELQAKLWREVPRALMEGSQRPTGESEADLLVAQTIEAIADKLESAPHVFVVRSTRQVHCENRICPRYWLEAGMYCPLREVISLEAFATFEYLLSAPNSYQESGPLLFSRNDGKYNADGAAINIDKYLTQNALIFCPHCVQFLWHIRCREWALLEHLDAEAAEDSGNSETATRANFMAGVDGTEEEPARLWVDGAADEAVVETSRENYAEEPFTFTTPDQAFTSEGTTSTLHGSLPLRTKPKHPSSSNMADSVFPGNILRAIASPVTAPPPIPSAVQGESDSGLGSDISPSPSPPPPRAPKPKRIPHNLIISTAERAVGLPKTPSRLPRSPGASNYHLQPPSVVPSSPSSPSLSDYEIHNLSATVPAHLAPKSSTCFCFRPAEALPMVSCDNPDCPIGKSHYNCLEPKEKATWKRWHHFTCYTCRTNQELAKGPQVSLADFKVSDAVKADFLGYLATPGITNVAAVRDSYGLASCPPVESAWAVAQAEYAAALVNEMDMEGDEEGDYYDEGDIDDNANMNDNHDTHDKKRRRIGPVECDNEMGPYGLHAW